MLYLLLAVTALFVGYLGYRQGSVPIFFASVVGMATSLGISDILAAGLLRLYVFRPHLAATVSQDNPLGFFLADFFAVPLLYSALTVAFPRRRVAVSIVLTVLLAGVEYGFLYAGAFVHQAWSIWFSLPLFFLRFLIAAWWITLLERVGYTPAFRAFLVAMSIYFAWLSWAVWISSIGRLWVIRPDFLAHPDSDRVLGMTLYHGLPFLVLGGLAVWLGWGRTLRGGLLSAVFLIAYLLWLDGSGLWQRAHGWGPLLEGAVLTVLVVAVSNLDRWFAAHLQKRARAGL